jgi:ribosomal protein S27AE
VSVADDDRAMAHRTHAAHESGRTYSRAAALIRGHRSSCIRTPIPLLMMDLRASPAIFVVLGIWRQSLIDIESAPWPIGVEAIAFVRRVLARVPEATTCDTSELALAVMATVQEERDEEVADLVPTARVTYRMLLCVECGTAYFGSLHRHRAERPRSVCGRCWQGQEGSKDESPPAGKVQRRSPRECRHCGKSFRPRRLASRRTYCSALCRVRARNRREQGVRQGVAARLKLSRR